VSGRVRDPVNSGEAEQTVVLPTPGRRRSQYAPALERPAAAADLSRLGGLNALVEAANPLPPLPIRATAAATACPGAATDPMTLGLPRARKTLLCLINAARATQGRRALKANHKLSVAAARFSREMVSKGFFAHVSPEGSTPITRVKAARYFRNGQQAALAVDQGAGLPPQGLGVGLQAAKEPREGGSGNPRIVSINFLRENSHDDFFVRVFTLRRSCGWSINMQDT